MQELDPRLPVLGDAARTRRLSFLLVVEAVHRHGEPTELHIDIGTGGELLHARRPVARNVVLLVAIRPAAERSAHVIDNDGRIRRGARRCRHLLELRMVLPGIERKSERPQQPQSAQECRFCAADWPAARPRSLERSRRPARRYGECRGTALRWRRDALRAPLRGGRCADRRNRRCRRTRTPGHTRRSPIARRRRSRPRSRLRDGNPPALPCDGSSRIAGTPWRRCCGRSRRRLPVPRSGSGRTADRARGDGADRRSAVRARGCPPARDRASRRGRAGADRDAARPCSRSSTFPPCCSNFAAEPWRQALRDLAPRPTGPGERENLFQHMSGLSQHRAVV